MFEEKIFLLLPSFKDFRLEREANIFDDLASERSVTQNRKRPVFILAFSNQFTVIACGKAFFISKYDVCLEIFSYRKKKRNKKSMPWKSMLFIRSISL